MSELVAKEIVKRFKKRCVVDAASLQVDSGEVVGLLGPNGAGKTTCFYMIVGLIACDEGHVFLDEKDITDLPMHARARLGLGYLPQEPSVFRKMTVLDNVLAILETRRELKPIERRELAENLLQELHVAHLRDHLGISLSGGERRRVEIARALAATPRFILLDEPFAGVDPLSVLDIQRIIKHLCKRGIGILITDHNVRETLGICHRAYILSDGRVIAEGHPSDILRNQQVRKVYLGDSFRL
jgi:lipopolysaccharide export system ATP-binding protein